MRDRALKRFLKQPFRPFNLFNIRNILDGFKAPKVVAVPITDGEEANVHEAVLERNPELDDILFSAFEIIEDLVN